MPEPQTAPTSTPAPLTEADYKWLVDAFRSGDRAQVDLASRAAKTFSPEDTAGLNAYVKTRFAGKDPAATSPSHTFASTEGMTVEPETVAALGAGTAAAVARGGVAALPRVGGSLASGETTSWLLKKIGVPPWAADLAGAAVGYGAYKMKVPSSVRMGTAAPSSSSAVNPSAASNTGTATAPTTTSGFANAPMRPSIRVPMEGNFRVVETPASMTTPTGLRLGAGRTIEAPAASTSTSELQPPAALGGRAPVAGLPPKRAIELPPSSTDPTRSWGRPNTFEPPAQPPAPPSSASAPPAAESTPTAAPKPSVRATRVKTPSTKGAKLAESSTGIPPDAMNAHGNLNPGWRYAEVGAANPDVLRRSFTTPEQLAKYVPTKGWKLVLRAPDGRTFPVPSGE